VQRSDTHHYAACTPKLAMGFASLYPSYGLRRDQRRVPPPQIIVRQVRATPPAINPIVSAEVFLVRDNRPAEFGKRQPASLVGRVAVAVVLLGDRAQLVVKARHGWGWAMREAIKESTGFQFVEDAPLAQVLMMEERAPARIAPSNELQQTHFRRAKSRCDGGKLFEQLKQGRP